jgi:hypothetical protein
MRGNRKRMRAMIFNPRGSIGWIGSIPQPRTEQNLTSVQGTVKPAQIQ